MSEASVTRVGVLGLGFMGRTHLDAYRAAAAAGHANRVVAVCDREVARWEAPRVDDGNLRLEAGASPAPQAPQVRRYTEAAQLFGDPELDLVSICTPTESHVDLACEALRAGKHVLLEKPVALRSREVERLRTVAAESGRLCMPAMCMRFWPGWRWLKDTVEAGTYGAVRSAVFRRLAAPPSWSTEFYADTARSGGALFDLHVHDADFVLWLFGEPRSVSSTGSTDHLTTLYRFADGPAHVVAEGGWDQTPGLEFHMSYRVIFEHATADFLFHRDPPLLLARDGECTPVELPSGTGYDAEVRHLLDCLASGGARGAAPLDATVEDALRLTRLLEAEGLSLATGAPARLASTGPVPSAQPAPARPAPARPAPARPAPARPAPAAPVHSLQACSDPMDVATRCADWIAAALAEHPGTVLILPAGRTPVPLYAELVRRHRAGELDLSGAHLVQLDELVGVGPRDPRSFQSFLREHLIVPAGLSEERLLLLDGGAGDPAAHIATHAARLAELEAPRLALVGIGRNGHVAFNEPGSNRDAPARVVELADRTRSALRAAFDPGEPPTHGMSLGIAELDACLRVGMIATGPGKADVLAALFLGPSGPALPASLLRQHPAFSVFADADARSMLPVVAP